jgi:soluble lytic murein transglycosylase-like protein
MARYTWKTLPSGAVQVAGKVPKLKGGLPEQVWLWRTLARKHGDPRGVPMHWILGVIYAESNGRPDAVSADRGIGLMQITHPGLKGGLSDAELLDPDTNVRVGTSFLATLRSSGPDWARELPPIASRYNAGQTRTGAPHRGPEPWGMRATGNHIDRVVAAANSALERLRAETPTPGGPSGDVLPFVLGLQVLRWLS